jgi:hypothetical protein
VGRAAGAVDAVEQTGDVALPVRAPDPGVERQRRRFLAGVLVLQVACLGLVLSRTFFVFDDMTLFMQAREKGFGLDYLRFQIFGHFAPGHRVLDYAAFRLGPMNWWVSSLFVVALLLATSVMLDKVVRFVAPDVAWPTLLIALFATSPLVMGSAMWWAAAGHLLPATLFSLVAALAALHYDRAPRWTRAAVFFAALVGALLCYEKAVVAPFGIAALLWALQDDGGFRTSLATAKRCWLLVVLSGVAVALFGVAISLGHYNEGTPHPSLTTWWHWAVQLFTSGPFAGAVGVSPNHFSGADRALLLWVAGGAVLAVVVGTSLRNRGAWRAWVFLGVWFLPAIALTAYGRAAISGPGVAGDFHYPGELAFLAVVALTIALTRPRRDTGTRPVVTPRRVALALVPVIALSLVSNVRYADRFPAAVPRSYVDNLERSADRLGIADHPDRYALLNTDLPEVLMPADFAPYNRVARVLDLLPATRGLSTTVDDDKTLLLVQPDGRMTPARLEETTRFTAEGGCESSGARQLPAGDVTPFLAVEGAPGTTVTVILPPVPGYGGYVPPPVTVAADGTPVPLSGFPGGELQLTPSAGGCVTSTTLLVPRPA